MAGFGIALVAQQVLFPAFGILTTWVEDVGIAACFTALSIARSYLLRRLFERIGSVRIARTRSGRSFGLARSR